MNNAHLNNIAFLLTALILTVSLAACGSSSPQSVSNDTSNDIQGYNIEGSYAQDGSTFQITTPLSVSSAGFSGEFRFYDAKERADFFSTLIQDISVSGNTATISGAISIKERDGSLSSGFTYTITITDEPDNFEIMVYKPDSSLYIELSSAVEDITGTFTIVSI